MTRLRQLLATRDQGATAVEYALLVAGIVAVCISIVFATFAVAGAVYDSNCEDIGTNSIATAPQACS